MGKFRILIVDDDQDFAESMAELFEIPGYVVETAFSGEEGIRKFKEKNFDLTFMDVKLPGMNGVESFLEIREYKPDAKVIMMTGFHMEELLGQALEKGAWAVLHKPLDTQKVLEMVRKISPAGVILVADDDPNFVESIKSLLETHHYTVFVALNGKEAIDRILSKGIDVLILDLQMPILNGLEVYLKLEQKGCSLPTIIVTAFATEEADALNTLRSVYETGILTKPFDPKSLLDTIEKFIKNKTLGPKDMNKTITGP